jgi:hypothetical protein
MSDAVAAATDETAGLVVLAGSAEKRNAVLLELVGKKVELKVQHSIRGVKPEPRFVVGQVLAFAQKLGHDQGFQGGEYTSPRGLVVQVTNAYGEQAPVWFVTVRTIESYQVLDD